MTNLEIIVTECALHGISENVHTYAKWRSMGYQVRRGSKALLKVALWKYKEGRTQEIENDDEVENESLARGSFRRVNAYLFGSSQVDPIKA